MQRGSNSTGVRRYNERLVLSTIRRLNGASKADISKLTGLSPQAAVRIVESLEESGRLIRAGRRTGGMGQPSIIYKVNGGSGCTVGVEIGRDRLICVLLDFDGATLARWCQPHDFPRPRQVIGDINAFMDAQMGLLPDAQQQGFLGIGIAMPWFLGEWRDELGITDAQAREWGASAIENHFRSAFDASLFFENDGNAGALAELLCGAGLGLRDFLYIHLGKFVGGGLVLGGQVHEGRNGNAGALASIPVPGRNGSDVLLHRASLYNADAGLPAETEGWLNDCADALSFAIIGANSLLDLEAVIVGSLLPEELTGALMERIGERIAANAPRDFFNPPLLRGHNGEIGPALGAGLLPLFASYAPNLGSLMKSSDSDAVPESASV